MMSLEMESPAGADIHTGVTGPWVGVKRHVDESPQRRAGEFDSIGEIVRRMRRQCESEMTHGFSPSLSLRLDLCLALEQCAEEGRP
jgi:hypothetical protein